MDNPFLNVNDDSKIMVIKINNTKDRKPIDFTKNEDLKKRASGGWVTTLKTLNETNMAILMFQGQVLAAYAIGDDFRLERNYGAVNKNNRKISPRIWLNLTEVQSNLQGKRIDYRTKNPISVATYKELKDKIK